MKKVLLVGNGLRGKTLAKYLNQQDYDVFDISNESTFSKISEINFQDYSEMVIATSENSKMNYIELALDNSINVLVEKPLLFEENILNSWQDRANEKGLLIRTAYAHRYESHVEKVKQLIEEGQLGEIYTISGFYGNGTAENIKNSKWRDSKYAVVIDLIPHLLNLMHFFIGSTQISKISLINKSFENNGSDFCILSGEANKIFFEFVVTYLSWQNRFNFEIISSDALVTLSGLEKWNNLDMTAYLRQHPPSVPNQLKFDFTGSNNHLLKQWLSFKDDISKSKVTDFESDLEISRILKSLIGDRVFNSDFK
jgi:predicted dehydrogenase